MAKKQQAKAVPRVDRQAVKRFYESYTCILLRKDLVRHPQPCHVCGERDAVDVRLIELPPVGCMMGIHPDNCQLVCDSCK